MADKTMYDPKITPEFVMECAKHGSVSVYSSQVCIRGRRELSLKTLTIPPCFTIEWIGMDGDHVILNLKITDSYHGA